MPDALGTVPAPPDLPAWAALYWQAFHDLNDDRTTVVLPMGGAAPGPIPWTAIDRWARRHGVEGADFDALVAVLGAMDAVFLDDSRRRRSS